MTTRAFANPAVVVEGWYWALRSAALRPGRAVAVTLMGRELALFRGRDGAVTALDAHCPHMGAHLAEGCVEGATLRCRFHGWRYDADGRCVEIPSLGGRPPFPVAARRWPVAEAHGLIWVWTGSDAKVGPPTVPELAGREVTTVLGPRFTKPCHPHVVLVNAIDEHHFNTVHRLPVRLAMAADPVAPHLIRFRNTTGPPDSTLGRLLRRLYGGPLTYAMAYAHGSTGTVTLGPDAWRFHLMFALRPTVEGGTEGHTVLVTPRRRGPGGAALSALSLLLTRLVSAYFARGDTRIFRSIRFDLRTPLAADHATLAFMEHLEAQPVVAWREAGRRAGPTEPAGAVGPGPDRGPVRARPPVPERAGAARR